jgi:hypothetical protein
VSLKLTADTESGTNTSIRVVVTANEGVREEVSRSSCSEIDPGLLNRFEDTFGIPIPL